MSKLDQIRVYGAIARGASIGFSNIPANLPPGMRVIVIDSFSELESRIMAEHLLAKKVYEVKPKPMKHGPRKAKDWMK